MQDVLADPAHTKDNIPHGLGYRRMLGEVPFDLLQASLAALRLAQSGNGPELYSIRLG